MALIDDIADDLAVEALRLEAELGDSEIVDQVAQILGSTSSTTQEAYLTSIRVRRAANRARDHLAELAKKLPG